MPSQPDMLANPFDLSALFCVSPRKKPLPKQMPPSKQLLPDCLDLAALQLPKAIDEARAVLEDLNKLRAQPDSSKEGGVESEFIGSFTAKNGQVHHIYMQEGVIRYKAAGTSGATPYASPMLAPSSPTAQTGNAADCDSTSRGWEHNDRESETMLAARSGAAPLEDGLANPKAWIDPTRKPASWSPPIVQPLDVVPLDVESTMSQPQSPRATAAGSQPAKPTTVQTARSWLKEWNAKVAAATQDDDIALLPFQ